MVLATAVLTALLNAGCVGSRAVGPTDVTITGAHCPEAISRLCRVEGERMIVRDLDLNAIDTDGPLVLIHDLAIPLELRNISIRGSSVAVTVDGGCKSCKVSIVDSTMESTQAAVILGRRENVPGDVELQRTEIRITPETKDWTQGFAVQTLDHGGTLLVNESRVRGDNASVGIFAYKVPR